MPASDRRYVYGYPRAVVRLVAGQLASSAIFAALFVVAPAYVAWHLLAGPWHMSIPWPLLGLPLGVVLLAVAWWVGRSIVTEARERFGLRVVPQFARALDPHPGTYITGHQLAANMQRLDALAAEAGASPLSHYGFARRRDPPAQWFAAAHGSATVATLLARVDPSSALHTELSIWLEALHRAEAAGVGFRLVVVTDTGMNDTMWQELQAEGF